MLQTAPVLRFGKMNSVVRFHLTELVDSFLPPDDFPLPADIRRMLLLFSGHIRVGTRSFLYIFYP